MKHYLLKTTLRLLLTVVMVYLLPMTAWGQGTLPSGGGSSAVDPYQISTRANLEWMADQIANHSTTFDGKFFKLTQDIDLGGTAWTPIGLEEGSSFTKYFAGTFDGDGYTISGLHIPTSGSGEDKGLFGQVGQNGVIKNLGVIIAPEGISISNLRTIKAGGIVGEAKQCTIENCYVTGGGIYCDGDFPTWDAEFTILMGSIAGIAENTTIQNCYGTIDITLEFDNAVAYANLATKGIRIAGIAGRAESGIIANCWYSGELRAHAKTIAYSHCYAAGITNEASAISNCLVLSRRIDASVDTNNNDQANYHVSSNAIAQSSSSFTTNYVSPSATLNGAVPSYDNDVNGTKWETKTDVATPLSTWIATGKWAAHSEWNNCMPTLKKKDTNPFQSSTKQPYAFKEIISISTAAELAAINTNAAHLAGPYKLTSDIDLAGYNGDNWTPIGATATPFKGTFDGDGHLIEGLNAEGATPIGLFGVIESGTVENLGVKFGTLKSTTTSEPIGGIAGEIKDNSTIQNCYTTGGAIIADLNSFGSTAAGGIIGQGSQSTILNCYSTCNISLVSTYLVYGGGIAGSGTNLTVSNCYSICKIKEIHGGDAGGGSAYAGGIIGGVSSIYGQPAEQSSVTNCLALSKDEFDLSNSEGRPDFHSGRILGEKGYNSNATLSGNYATTLMPGSWTAIGADKNDGGDWNGANCTPSDPDAWDIAWTDMTISRAIAGSNLPKLKTIGGALINGQGDIDKLLYIGFKLTTTSDANGSIEVKSTSGGTLYNNGDYIPTNTELTITAKPNSSYETASLKVSDNDFTSGTTYLVGSELATKGTNLAIAATFTLPTHTVTVDAAIVNGSIEVKKPDGTTLTPGANTVEEGTVLTITAPPATGYQLKQLTADGNPINGNTYTVTGDVTLSAEFEAKSGGGNEGDGGGSTTPTVYHTVTLPAVEGATTDPVAGDYEVEAWGSFRFFLTLDKEYDKSEPVITTDRGETIQTRSSDGAYIVKYVRSDVQILIDGIIKNPDPVGNETVTANQSKVWAAEGYLHIEAATDGQAYIFTADGRLQKLQPLTAGQAIALPLPEGVYLVRIGDERFKVLL